MARVSILLSLLLAAAAIPLPAKPAAGSFVPNAAAAGAAALDGSVFHAESPGLSVRLALLDDASRQRFLRSKTGIETDPFLSDGSSGSPAFLTFLLELENRSQGTIYFQPLMCPITTPQGDIRNPLDAQTLQASYEMLDRTLPPAYAKVAKALFSDQQTLAPGQKASGLLAYRSSDLRTRTLQVRIQATTASGEAIELQFPYRFVKGQK